MIVDFWSSSSLSKRNRFSSPMKRELIDAHCFLFSRLSDDVCFIAKRRRRGRRISYELLLSTWQFLRSSFLILDARSMGWHVSVGATRKGKAKNLEKCLEKKKEKNKRLRELKKVSEKTSAREKVRFGRGRIRGNRKGKVKREQTKQKDAKSKKKSYKADEKMGNDSNGTDARRCKMQMQMQEMTVMEQIRGEIVGRTRDSSQGKKKKKRDIREKKICIREEKRN